MLLFPLSAWRPYPLNPVGESEESGGMNHVMPGWLRCTWQMRCFKLPHLCLVCCRRLSPSTTGWNKATISRPVEIKTEELQTKTRTGPSYFKPRPDLLMLRQRSSSQNHISHLLLVKNFTVNLTVGVCGCYFEG